jgi:hypothetical protein
VSYTLYGTSYRPVVLPPSRADALVAEVESIRDVATAKAEARARDEA